MSSRLHNRNYFFKYASLETAKFVVESHSFRWSSPTKFNDPFDHQAGFTLNFSPEEFSAALSASIERFIFSEVEPVNPAKTIWSENLLKLRQMRHKLSRSEVLRDLNQSSNKSAAILDKSFKQFNDSIKDQLCHSRVFCVSEKHDNVVMWSHYADQHKGVVFKLQCIDEIDNMLLAARKVHYTNSFVPFPSPDVYARYITGEQSFKISPLIWDIAFTKHIDWSYEEEWRVHRPLLTEPSGDGYSIYPENPRIFEAIYLGCCMKSEE